MVKKYKTLKLLNCFTQVFFEQQYFNPIPLFTWVFLGLLMAAGDKGPPL